MRLRRPMTAALFEFDIDHPGLVSGIAVRASAELAARGSTVDNREFGGNCLGSSRDNLLLWRLGREKKEDWVTGGVSGEKVSLVKLMGATGLCPIAFFFTVESSSFWLRGVQPIRGRYCETVFFFFLFFFSPCLAGSRAAIGSARFLQNHLIAVG